MHKLHFVNKLHFEKKHCLEAWCIYLTVDPLHASPFFVRLIQWYDVIDLCV